jgi:3'-5' exoribonuclease
LPNETLKGDTVAERKYIADFREGDAVSQIFHLNSRNRLLTRSGKPYLSLNLQDKTGTISAKVWENADAIHGAIGSAGFVRIGGRVEKYMEELQLRVNQLAVVRTEDVELSDFLRASTRSPDEMLNELRQISQTIEDRHLKSLLRLVFADADLMDRFKLSPGAKHLHHCFIGGLLEHTLSVTRICDWLCGHYQNIRRDLLIAGAILHDVGKVFELTSSPVFDYTAEGRLVGHLMLGWAAVEEKIRQVEGFPQELQINLEHLMLSHHGSYEFRSPVVPKTVEAMLLHHVDDLDAKVQLTQDWIEQSKGEPSEFTPYHKLLDRYFYKGPPKKEEEKG